ncbi:MAG: DUF805 domain-containing protein [Sphingobium sp.]|nr:DUF805 domain-containing protein [Sphingobium sp.]
MIDENAVNRIEDLHKLKEAGVITEEEFDKAKQELLFRPRPAKTASQKMQVFSGGANELPGDDDFIGWMFLPLRKYADFDGRSCRKEYWMFALLYIAALFIGGVFSIASVELGMTLMSLFILAVFIPTVAVQVRRMHDQDKSGWFVLFNIIPYVGWIIGIIFMLIDGTEGDNRYGPDPKGRA